MNYPFNTHTHSYLLKFAISIIKHTLLVFIKLLYSSNAVFDLLYQHLQLNIINPDTVTAGPIFTNAIISFHKAPPHLYNTTVSLMQSDITTKTFPHNSAVLMTVKPDKRSN